MKTAILYAGQGSQRVGMGQDFYETYPAFRETIDRAEEVYKKHSSQSLKNLMFQGPAETLTLTRYTQPAMGAFALGISRLMQEAGFKADYAAGLSLGEYSALAMAGVFSPDQLIDLLAFRGEAMEEAARGLNTRMSACLGIGREDLAQAVQKAAAYGVVEISNYNSTGQIVIAGQVQAVKEAELFALEAGAKKCIPLQVSGPFHTSYMKAAGEKLKERFRTMTWGDMEISVLFNATGRELGPGETISDLLVTQVQSAVHMEDIILELEKKGVDTIIEVGPGKTLSGFVRRTAKGIKCYSIDTVADYEKLQAEGIIGR